jgi:hypothetical protein
VGEVGDLIRQHGAADAGMLGPADTPGSKKARYTIN